jgi:hypothetical protein
MYFSKVCNCTASHTQHDIANKGGIIGKESEGEKQS